MLFLRIFDTVKDMSPESFVSEYLISRLSAGAVLCGFNFKFGKGGAGDSDTLASLLSPHGVACRVIDPVLFEGEVIS